MKLYWNEYRVSYLLLFIKWVSKICWVKIDLVNFLVVSYLVLSNVLFLIEIIYWGCNVEVSILKI